MSRNKLQKTDKIEEAFFRLTLREDFLTEVKVARRLFAIPRNGLASKENIDKWTRQNEAFPVREFRFYFYKEGLLKRYGFMPTAGLMGWLQDYILSNGNIKTAQGRYGAVLTLQTPSKKEVRNAGRSFVKLWIFAENSREDVLSFVRSNWKIIKPIISLENGKPIKRVRPIKNKELIRAVISLNKLPINVLRGWLQTSKEAARYKIPLIVMLLKKWRYLNVTQGSVKKIIERHKPYKVGH